MVTRRNRSLHWAKEMWVIYFVLITVCFAQPLGSQPSPGRASFVMVLPRFEFVHENIELCREAFGIRKVPLLGHIIRLGDKAKGEIAKLFPGVETCADVGKKKRLMEEEFTNLVHSEVSGTIRYVIIEIDVDSDFQSAEEEVKQELDEPGRKARERPPYWIIEPIIRHVGGGRYHISFRAKLVGQRRFSHSKTFKVPRAEIDENLLTESVYQLRVRASDTLAELCRKVAVEPK